VPSTDTSIEKALYRAVSWLPFGEKMLGSAYSLQMLIYFLIGGLSSVINIVIFSFIYYTGASVFWAAVMAYLIAAMTNYFMCTCWAFKSPTRWCRHTQLLLYLAVVAMMALVDAYMTSFFIHYLPYAFMAKALACMIGYFINFFLRKYIVFREQAVVT
jgi:putative flippase GtrA